MGNVSSRGALSAVNGFYLDSSNKLDSASDSAVDYIDRNINDPLDVYDYKYTGIPPSGGLDAAEQDIYSNQYNLVDRILYGGICSGAIVIPTNFLKIILTIIFPPLGTILDIIENELLAKFPWVTWNTLYKLFQYENLNKIIYTFILTSMFYIPGLIYTLAQLTTKNNIHGTLRCDAVTGDCVDITTITTPQTTKSK